MYKEWVKMDNWKIPSLLGFAVIGSIQWYHLTHEKDPQPADLLSRLPEKKSAVEEQMVSERQFQALKMFPYRIASRVWGMVHDIPLPLWAREPMYKAWTKAFDCKLDEMKYPLDHYKNLGEFFSRPLKDGVRPIEIENNTLTSPVDGRVMALGIADSSQPVPLLEQIKGARYRMDDFLGAVPRFFRLKDNDETRLFYCVLYLAPGDYHRIHSPADWVIAERRHFPGTLFPVSKRAVQSIPNLFALNERVVLLGNWLYGFFSLTAVGATNVGSIHLDVEEDLRTNVSGQGRHVDRCLAKLYKEKHMSTRGDQVAQFKLGSTVVLVFEAPKDFTFTIAPDQRIQMGQGIGRRAGENPSTTFPTTSEVIRLATEEETPSEDSMMQEISDSITKVVGEAFQQEAKSHRSKNLVEEPENIRDCFAGLGPAYTGKAAKNDKP